MEPLLRYATTSDGVGIAYAVAGSGPPLVRITGGLWDHAQGYWRIPPMRRQLERLSSRLAHIQYDARGTGLSQRGVADFSLEAQIRDLEAVVAANQLGRFDLLCHFTGGFAGMTYAARNPGRVGHLILVRPHLRGSDYFNARVIRAMAAYRQMASEDWWGYLGTIANRSLRFEQPEIARLLMSVYNESMTPETVRLFEEQYSQIDITGTPEKVACPTLVLVESGRAGFQEDFWREVTALIPDVSLVMLDASLPLAWLDEATDAVLAFLGEEDARHPSGALAEALQVAMLVLTPGLDREDEDTLRDIARAKGSVAFLRQPEGYAAWFRSAQMALEAAIATQGAFAGKPGLALRIGVDAVEQVGDDRVREAERGRLQQVAQDAQAGEIVATDVVRQLVTGKGFQFAGRPRSAARGPEEPLTLFALRW